MVTYTQANFKSVTNASSNLLNLPLRDFTGKVVTMAAGVTLDLTTKNIPTAILASTGLIRLANGGVLTINSQFDIPPTSNVDFGPAAVASITVSNGIVTAIS